MILEALIFDVDGTLSETEEAHRHAFNQVFREEGLGWHWDRDLYRKLLKVTGGKERMTHYVNAYRPEFKESVLDAGRIVGLHKNKTAIYTDLVKSGAAALRPGVKRLIDEARDEGFKVGIATTTSLPNIEALLDSTFGKGAIRDFGAVAAGDMVEKKKPAPDIYDLALKQLGLPADACLAFEDSVLGVQSAAAAGIASVVTPSIYTDTEDFSHALACVSHLGDDDAPATFVSGAALDGDRVTVAQLRTWHAAHIGGRVEV